MKHTKLLKAIIVSTFAFTLAFSAIMPAMEVKAASNTVELRHITGDGVRLRQEGYSGGTVLELMYTGESIYFYPYILGSDTEYNYMKRIETGTYGFVDHHYTR